MLYECLTSVLELSMEKKLSKHGNSRAIVIEKPILDLLSITDNTVLKVTTEDGKIIIEPVRRSKKMMKISSDKKMQKIYEEIVEKYGPALKKLAKN